MAVLHGDSTTPNYYACRAGDAAWLSVLWALSGFSVLALETLWMREVALRVGSTAVASALVVTVFFVSAALGNLFGGRFAARRGAVLSAYALFEGASALSALASLALYRSCWVSVSAAQSAPWAALMGAALLAAVPSFLSGASFPCLAEAVVPGGDRRTASAGVLYGANLFGAALGVVAGGVLLPWTCGATAAFALTAALQAAGGLCAWRLSGRVRAAGVARAARAAAPSAPAAAGWLALAASGVLALASQTLLIVWARQVLEGSVYAACGVLADFLVGLGAGGWAAALLRRRGWPALRLLGLFACGSSLGLVALAGVAPSAVAAGGGLTADAPPALLAQALLACLPALPLAFLMGGVFPAAWELVGSPSASEGRVLGRAMALNKAGAAAGAAAGLFVLLPRAGLVHGTLVAAAGYLALCLVALACGSRRAWLPLVPVGAAAALLAALAVRSEPALGTVAGERVLSLRSGAYGPVAVLERASDGSRQILLNSRQRLSGTRRALLSQRCQSWLPLLLCRRPERLFTLGMAAGISAAAALDFPVRELVSVELVPEVVEAARDHFAPWNAALFSDPRSRVVVGDGRAALAREAGRFDAIIADLFYPAEEGTASLYSREFFALCRAKLAPGGLCCLWLPCDQHTAATAGVVLRTFAEAFPCAVALRANFDPLQPVIGLVGSESAIPLSHAALAERLATPEGRRLASASPLFGSAEALRLAFVMDLRTAEPGFGAFEATTDDRPLFAYLGPRRPRAGERLFGFPLLAWCGRRALRPSYPSCALDGESPDALVDAVRAGNYSYAAVAASISLPGDSRAPGVLEEQVSEYRRQACARSPAAAGVVEAWSKALGVELGGVP